MRYFALVINRACGNQSTLGQSTVACDGDGKQRSRKIKTRSIGVFGGLLLSVLLFEQTIYAQDIRSTDQEIKVSDPAKATKIREKKAKKLSEEGHFLQSVEIYEQLLLDVPETQQTKGDRGLWVGTAAKGLLAVFRERIPKNIHYLERGLALLDRYEQDLRSTYKSAKMDFEVVTLWRKAINKAKYAWEKERKLAKEEYHRFKIDASNEFKSQHFSQAARSWRRLLQHTAAPAFGQARAELMVNAIESMLHAYDLKPDNEWLEEATQMLKKLKEVRGNKAEIKKIQSEHDRLSLEISQRQQRKIEVEKIALDRRDVAGDPIRYKKGVILTSVGGGAMALSIWGFITGPLPTSEKEVQSTAYGLATVGAVLGTATLIWGIIELRKAKRGGDRASSWPSRRTVHSPQGGLWEVFR